MDGSSNGYLMGNGRLLYYGSVPSMEMHIL